MIKQSIEELKAISDELKMSYIMAQLKGQKSITHEIVDRLDVVIANLEKGE